MPVHDFRMSRRRDLPESLHGSGFTTAAAAAVGVPGNRLQSNDLFGVYRGIRVPRGVPQDLEDRLRPVLELVPCGAAYRTTAARIFGMPLPGWVDDDAPRLELAVPAGTSQIRRPGLAVRRVMLPASDVIEVGGIRITTPERTFADLASLLGLADTVAVGDHLVCEHGPDHPGERDPLVPLDVLARYIGGIKGRHGILRAREALDLVRIGADSPPETRLRLALQDAGLPEPVLGMVLRDGYGRPVLFPDLAYPDYRLLVQYDGSHHLSAVQSASDGRRESAALLLGWKSVVITKDDVDAGDYRRAVGRIRTELRRRGWDPDAPVRLVR